MRVFVMMGAVIAVMASASGTCGAQTVKVKQVFEKFGQIGTFAWDCSKPPGADNFFYVNRALDDDHVQRDEMIGPSERRAVTIIDKATILGPNEFSLSGKRDDQVAEAVWRVEPNRQVAWEVSFDGKKVISGGKLVSNGRPVPWTNKCPGQ